MKDEVEEQENNETETRLHNKAVNRRTAGLTDVRT